MPDLGVTVVVMRDNEVLLTKREDFAIWCLPGGSVDVNESVEQAGVREVREETGLVVTIVGLVGICSHPFGTRSGGHNVVLAAAPQTHVFVPEPSEVTALDYFALDQLPEPLLWDHLTYIRAAFARAWGQLWTSSARIPEEFLDRAALYRWRDELGVSREEAGRRLIELIGSYALTNSIGTTDMDPK